MVPVVVDVGGAKTTAMRWVEEWWVSTLQKGNRVVHGVLWSKRMLNWSWMSSGCRPSLEPRGVFCQGKPVMGAHLDKDKDAKCAH